MTMIHNWVDRPADRENRELARQILSSGYSPKEKDQQLAALSERANHVVRDRAKLVVVDEWYKQYRRRVFTTARTRAVVS
jgi:hypothetical protein